MPAVVHVISVIDVVNIDFVGAVPNRRPGFWAGINHPKPEAPELEARGTLDHYDGHVVDAKPVSTAKVRAEAIFRNAVSMVAAAFVPGMMLASPIMRTLALPDVLPRKAWFGPSNLAQLPRGMPAVGWAFGAPLERVMGFMTVLMPLFQPVFLVFAVLRLRLASMFLFVNVSFAPVRTTFVISPPVLRDGKNCRSQEQSQY